MKLTNAERLELTRRRFHWTQAQMAEFLGVTPNRYMQWERGRRYDAPKLRFDGLQVHEWCYLLRKRCGWTLLELQEKCGIKSKWIHRAERGEIKNIDPLSHWWLRQQGHSDVQKAAQKLGEALVEAHHEQVGDE